MLQSSRRGWFFSLYGFACLAGGGCGGDDAIGASGTSDIGSTSGGSSSSGSTSMSSISMETTTATTTGAPICGDEIVDDPEVCDDGVNDGSYGGCAVGCQAPGPRCGDGVVQPEHEECDEAEANSDKSVCTEACRLAVCGDALIHAGVEVCDDGENDGSYGGCGAGCQMKGPHCGDGII